MAKKDLLIISVGATIFLGDLVKAKEETTIKDALALPAGATTVTKQHMADYLKAENLGNLQTIDISGNGATFAKQALSKEQALDFEILQLQMKQAVETAPKRLVNSEFDAILGK